MQNRSINGSRGVRGAMLLCSALLVVAGCLDLESERAEGRRSTREAGNQEAGNQEAGNRVSSNSEMPLFAHPGGCRQCHEDPKEGSLKSEKEQVCSSEGCHSTFERARYMHGPVVSHDCTVCHRPHSSSNADMLIMEKVELCVRCHGKLYTCPVAETFEPEECTSCHDAHSGDNPEFLKPGHAATASTLLRRAIRTEDWPAPAPRS